MTEIITVKRLQKVIQDRPVLDIDQLAVQAGEAVAVIGASGSGKAALLDVLTGRTQPTAGTVQVCGLYPAQNRTEIARLTGVQFQRNAHYKRISVRRNLTFYCDLHGLPHQRADEVLETVGLRDHAKAKVQGLPEGLARRLSLGRALLHQPQILFLYEPFSRCDVGSIHVITDLINQQVDSGVAVLILAIEPAHLGSICNTLHTLENGHLTASRAFQSAAPDLPFKIPARLDGKVMLINTADILYVTSENGQTTLTTHEGTFPVHFTLVELEERLSRSGFFRAHRSYLVNLQHIKEVIAYTRDSYTLRLDTTDHAEIPLSKTSARELREMLGF